MDTPRSIVVVKLSAIGDVLHGVPVAVALRRVFPDAAIGWAIEGRAADVLAGHPAVDHLFRLPRGWLKSPATVLRLRRQLRAFKPDVTIDLQGLLKSGVATWLSGARMRIGFARPMAREQSWLAYTNRVKPVATHVVDRNCDLLVPLGIRERRPEFAMPRWPISRERVQQWLTSLRLSDPPVVINPGAGWASKRWEPERFAALGRSLHQRYGIRPLVVWGGAAERATAERIAAACDDAAIVATATSLQDLGELFRRSRLLISADTGPLHLAAAVGTPCVGLFGPVPAARNGPYGSQHVCVEPPEAARPAWEDRKTDAAAMAAVEVDAVLAAVETLLARSRAAA
ncbi:MAG: glycosyltransferase family 9 protein [Planctomycetes bacterium]|nr:glycosyltransferase family 9 protein [Planctomycetota bacterium]